ncbi:MAG: hypothetical protein ABL995_04500 [Bryobacteraceae bacterium]
MGATTTPVANPRLLADRFGRIGAVGHRVFSTSKASPLARAMTATGAAALASAALNSLAAKILAITAGPGAIALYATLQQTRQAALLTATANGQTALVQGASALEGREHTEFVRTAACIFAGFTCFTALLLLASPTWLSVLIPVPNGARDAVRLLSIGVSLLSAFVFLTALLAAAGKIPQLASSQIAGSAGLAAAAWPAASLAAGGRLYALAHLLNVSAALSVVSGGFAVHRFRTTFAEWFRGPGSWWSSRAAGRFFSTSGAMLASGLLSSAVLLAVRARIIESQGTVTTGQFDAAWAISMSHVTLVLGSMQSYYLPALAKARLDSDRVQQISTTLTAAVLITASVIAVLSLTKPWVLTMFYSGSFRAGSRFLRWTLVGDYCKVASWTLSIPMLARGDIRTFFAADILAYGAFFVGSAWFSKWAGAAEGAAMGFAAMYAMHFLFCSAVVRFGYGLTLHGRAWKALAAGFAVISLAAICSWNQN